VHFGAGIFARPFLLPAVMNGMQTFYRIVAILLRFMVNYGLISRPKNGLNTDYLSVERKNHESC